jgi:Putative lumazine-binding
MKHFLILLTVITIAVAEVKAQSSEDSVKSVINKMFTGMKNGDTSLLKSSFADSAILQTITRNKEGNIVVENESKSEFIDFVSKQSPGSADERISFETIKTDGPLAIAWAPYNFYFKGQFSHCGVNSFQLVRFNDGWKIQYIIDTRRKQGCKSE